MAVKTYDPKQISVILGTTPITGFADGDFVAVERTESAFTMKIGADGESGRSKSANRSGKVTLTLLATSASNDYLSNLALTDDATGFGTFALLIKDNYGTTKYTAVTAWVDKVPNLSFGKEIGTREWVLMTDELLPYIGGGISQRPAAS